MTNKPLRIAMIAPPWVAVPPSGYGGIEVVVDNLVRGLVALGHEVELFSIGKSKIKGIKVHSLYQDEQFGHIHKPIYESLPVAVAHLHFALNKIIRDGKFDIIHDHNGFIGPAVLHFATKLKIVPPAVHTYHGPPLTDAKVIAGKQPDNHLLWDQVFDKNTPDRLHIVGISKSIMHNAPPNLRSHLLAPVHNAVDVNEFTFKNKKKPYFVTLGRFSTEKNQHLAAKLCDELGYALKMAGTVSSIGAEKELLLEITNPMSKYRNMDDFKYYSDKVLPLTIKNKKIKYVGEVSGKQKLGLLADARALLFPIAWEEPFGMVVIEAMACGTPVVAMNRGAMPEIIEHGVNGFLAKNEAEFKHFMTKIGEIDPSSCRQSVERKFSANEMARKYADRYQKILSLK